jgi:hypothetical protein
MRYQHALEIYERLEIVLQLIGTGRYSTPALAKKVGVSIPTISRIVAALRERGHDIQAEKARKAWRYVLNTSPARQSNGSSEKSNQASQLPKAGRTDGRA